MKFGSIETSKACRGILAHTLRLPEIVLRKGHVLTESDLENIKQAGFEQIIIAQLEENDIGEDDAALKIGGYLETDTVRLSGGNRGRVNLRAIKTGLLLINTEVIHELNTLDEAITIATLPPNTVVKENQVIATVKIITFGVELKTIENCADIINKNESALSVAAFKTLKVGFIQTVFPTHKESLSRKASNTTSARLGELGLKINEERTCKHEVSAIAAILKEFEEKKIDITLVLGASAIVDRRDVVPTAVNDAGGSNEHLGLPVDPGNLMLLSKVKNMTVLGIPGSARSSRLHGFDWVLQRLAAGINVNSRDLMRMGVGGMLKEMPSRPVFREQEITEEQYDLTNNPSIAGVLLAAGQSRRMGKINKMLLEINGKPMVVHAAEALIASNVEPVIVVVGHEAEAVKKILSGFSVTFISNENFSHGLSASLKTGLNALPENIDGAVVSLADMPNINSQDINQLIDAFDPKNGQSICVPTYAGKRGNPVLWGKRYFADIANVSGDVGARHIIGQNADQVMELISQNPGILIDLDTPTAVEEYTNPKSK
tara:strand:- start:212 stop:1849 length:1638 start_codon:yes stop_codon:yes gene_type:complete